MAKRSNHGETWFGRINLFFLSIVTLICLYPLYYTVIASLSDTYAVSTGKVTFLPIGVSLDAYKLVFVNKDIWIGYRNTILYTVFGTLFDLFLTLPLAYGLSKKNLPGHGIITWYFLLTMYFSGGLIPTYIVIKNLGFVNSPFALVILGALSVYNTIIVRVYFTSSIPEALYEAARIDGASEMHVFIKIALPLAIPVVAVTALYYAVGHWNNYFTSLIYITDKKLQPLQLVLRRILILNESAVSEEALREMSGDELVDSLYKAYIANVMKYSIVFIASAPMLAAYPFIQKYFIKGIMIGSLKG